MCAASISPLMQHLSRARTHKLKQLVSDMRIEDDSLTDDTIRCETMRAGHTDPFVVVDALDAYASAHPDIQYDSSIAQQAHR